MKAIDSAARRARQAMSRRGFGMLGLATTLTMGLALGACTPEPPPPPTLVNLGINAGPMINMSPAGQPAPVQVHVYWLRAATAMQQADFFQVTEQPEATLGQELVAHQQVTVRPGQGVSIQRTANQGETHVGIVAAYRDLDTVNWRSVATLQPHAQNFIDVDLGPRGVSLSMRPPLTARAVAAPVAAGDAG
ncbi:type VI secretion system lipoprotein TssJ [uncultured Rhodospira sp.]|uniref:type VI secretion system lipoprotein TssJ n=1 Tax=uncultured Rhodospira sp. TaxID=1936189 RepID=UPI002620001E|nr:type VI secretion system lipoprotein TssJ [uncultured Rhodospira sp.]